MKDRVNDYLDGELSWEELSADEQEDARRIENVAALLRQDAATFEDTDLAPAVMEDIAARARRSLGHEAEARPSLAARLLAVLTRPREVSFRFRPAHGLAAILMLVAAASWLPVGVSVGGAGIEAPAATPSVFVRFEVDAPDASTVRLAGSFSGWKPDIQMRRVANGRWAVLVPLRPGVHDYAFQIDGDHWTTDPFAPRVADGFGGYNSRLSLVLTDS
jgi:hypothetical protein